VTSGIDPSGATPLYELRKYRVAPGRLADFEHRMCEVLPPLFRRAGFQPPVAQWTCEAGADMPLFVWLARWERFEQRELAYAQLYADPEWPVRRRQTNGPGEMLLGYDFALLKRGIEAATAIPLDLLHGSTERALHELRIYAIYPGRTEQAMQSLRTVHLPALAAAGATDLGIFNVLIGSNLPSIVQFLAWKDYSARTAGLRHFSENPRVRTLLAEERSAVMTQILGRYESWLMKPVADKASS
jgi:hypothetical protein